MFFTEKFNSDTESKLWNWGQYDCYKLKHNYKNPHTGEVKTYKLSNKQMEEYLSLNKEEANKFLENIKRGK